jgi:hypothetical protein
MMLSVESREAQDERSLGELFLYFTDEMADITWLQAFELLLQMFQQLFADYLDLTAPKITELVDAFMTTIPTALQRHLNGI